MNWGAFCGRMQQLNHSSPVVRDALVVFTEDFMGGGLASRAYHVTSDSSFWKSFDSTEKLLGSALDGNDNDVDILADYVLAETPTPVAFCLILSTPQEAPTPSPVLTASSCSPKECYDMLRKLFESGQVSDVDIEQLRTVSGTRALFGPLYGRALITSSTIKVFEEEGSPYSKTPILFGNKNWYLYANWTESDVPAVKQFLAKYGGVDAPCLQEPEAPVQLSLPLERSFCSIETEYINWLCETREVDRATAEEYVEIARFVEDNAPRFGLASGAFVSAPDYVTAKGTLDALRSNVEFKTELNDNFQDRNIGDARLFLKFLEEKNHEQHD